MTAPGEGRPTLRRRRLLALLGAAGTGAVGGCIGGDDEPDDEGAGAAGGQDRTNDQQQTDEQGQDDDPEAGADGPGDGDVSCPEWSDLERVDLEARGVADFPVIPRYPVGWEQHNAFVEADEAILAVADPAREPGNVFDYVSVQVRLIEADGALPSRADWPTRDWVQAQDEADPVRFEGQERSVGFHGDEFEALWEFTAAGPNDTHMLVTVIVRFRHEACSDGMIELGREVLDTLELNHASEI